MSLLGIRERWRSLPPEQKELVFLGIHGAVLAGIGYGARKEGLRVSSLVRERPGLVVAGSVLGTAYYILVKRFVIEK